MKNCITKNGFRKTSISKIIIRIRKKHFCGKGVVRKHQSFYPKDFCSFSVFLFKWRGVKPTCMSNKICKNQHVCLIKYVKNKISNSTFHKKKEKKRKKREVEGQKQSNFKNIISKTPKKLSLVTLVTNYHKLSLLPFAVTSWQKFEKKNRCCIFNLLICTSNKLYFQTSKQSLT